MKTLEKAIFRANTLKGMLKGIKNRRNTNQLKMMSGLADGLAKMLEEIKSELEKDHDTIAV